MSNASLYKTRRQWSRRDVARKGEQGRAAKVHDNSPRGDFGGKAGGILSGRERHNETIRRSRVLWTGCGVAAACAVLKEDWVS